MGGPVEHVLVGGERLEKNKIGLLEIGRRSCVGFIMTGLDRSVILDMRHRGFLGLREDKLAREADGRPRRRAAELFGATRRRRSQD
jgi:hypothetical protein